MDPTTQAYYDSLELNYNGNDGKIHRVKLHPDDHAPCHFCSKILLISSFKKHWDNSCNRAIIYKATRYGLTTEDAWKKVKEKKKQVANRTRDYRDTPEGMYATKLAKVNETINTEIPMPNVTGLVFGKFNPDHLLGLMRTLPSGLTEDDRILFYHLLHGRISNLINHWPEVAGEWSTSEKLEEENEWLELWHGQVQEVWKRCLNFDDFSRLQPLANQILAKLNSLIDKFKRCQHKNWLPDEERVPVPPEWRVIKADLIGVSHYIVFDEEGGLYEDLHNYYKKVYARREELLADAKKVMEESRVAKKPEANIGDESSGIGSEDNDNDNDNGNDGSDDNDNDNENDGSDNNDNDNDENDDDKNVKLPARRLPWATLKAANKASPKETPLSYPDSHDLHDSEDDYKSVKKRDDRRQPRLASNVPPTTPPVAHPVASTAEAPGTPTTETLGSRRAGEPSALPVECPNLESPMDLQKEKRWLENLALLKMPPPRNTKKGKGHILWCGKQRAYWRKGILRDDRKKMLMDVGFDFDPDTKATNNGPGSRKRKA